MRTNGLALTERAIEMADARGMPLPSEAKHEEMVWGMKAVAPDLTAYGGFRWPFPGSWCEAGNIDPANTGPCPMGPGDGLCVGKTWYGMASGGRSAATLLLVGHLPDDVLGEDTHKSRDVRCYVRDVVDGFALVREHGAGANLGDANLGGADLRDANLGGAYLGGAYLGGADLGGADLGGAYLGGADLRGADLRGANLYGANLGGADLRDANLYGANLGGAYLRGANLYGARTDRFTRWPEGFDTEAAGVGRG